MPHIARHISSLCFTACVIACFRSDWSALAAKVALQNRSGLLHQKQPGRVRHWASLHCRGLQQTSKRRCLPLMEPYWSVLVKTCSTQAICNCLQHDTGMPCPAVIVDCVNQWDWQANQPAPDCHSVCVSCLGPDVIVRRCLRQSTRHMLQPQSPACRTAAAVHNIMTAYLP